MVATTKDKDSMKSSPVSPGVKNKMRTRSDSVKCKMTSVDRRTSTRKEFVVPTRNKERSPYDSGRNCTKLRSEKKANDSNHSSCTSLAQLSSFTAPLKSSTADKSAPERKTNKGIISDLQKEQSVISEEDLLTEIDILLDEKGRSDDELFTPATKDKFTNSDGLRIKKEATTDYWDANNASLDSEAYDKRQGVPDPMEIVVEEVLSDSEDEIVAIQQSNVDRQGVTPKISSNTTNTKRRLQSEGVTKKQSKKFFSDVKTFEKEFYTNKNDTMALSDDSPKSPNETAEGEDEPTKRIEQAERTQNMDEQADDAVAPIEDSDCASQQDLQTHNSNATVVEISSDMISNNQRATSPQNKVETATKTVTFPLEDTVNVMRYTETNNPAVFGSNAPSKIRTDSQSMKITKRKSWDNAQKLRVIALSNASFDQRLKHRGQAMVEESTYLCTPVKIEFNIAKEVIEYNARKHLLILLEKMQEVDDSLRIQSIVNEKTEWVDLDTIPEAEEFSDHFKMKDFNYRTHKKVIVHMNMVSLSPVNRIKYSRTVKEHIYRENIWLKTDKYNAKVESSPGFLIKAHPKLVHREDFIDELRSTLLQLPPHQSEKVVVDWYQVNNIIMPTHGRSITVPVFHLEPSVKKWGSLRTEVLRVTCSTDDAEYLKFLLSLASNQGMLTTGTFVPAGLHLMQGKDIVSSILREQQQYIQTTIGVPITGILPMVMEAQLPDKESTVKELIQAFEEVHSVERTSDTENYGRWMVVTSDKNREVVLNKLNKSLALLYKAQHGQTRIITAGTREIQADNSSPTTVSTYAEVLSQKYAAKKPLPPALKGTAKYSSMVTRDLAKKKHLSSIGRDEVRTERTPAINDTIISQQFDALTNRLKSLETKQAELDHTQSTQQNEHSQQTQDKIQSLADKQNELLQLEERMEKKLQEMDTREKKFFHETEETILQQVDKTVESKLNTMSKLVAAHVTAQLMEAMQSYRHNPTRTFPPQLQTTELPLLTQDVLSPEGKPPTEDTQTSSELVKKLPPSGMYDMKQALSEIETNSSNLSPPHDITPGRSTAPDE